MHNQPVPAQAPTTGDKKTRHLPPLTAQLRAKAFDQPGSPADPNSLDPGWIEGYVAVFGNVDSDGERIWPGAFTKSIQERVAARKVPLMARHFIHGGDAASVIGTIVEAREDNFGLWIHAELASTSLAQDIRRSVLEGHLSGLSVSFQTIRKDTETTADGDIVNLRELKILEGTITPFPANELAQITGAKSQDGTVETPALVMIAQRIDRLENQLTALSKSGTAPAATDTGTAADFARLKEEIQRNDRYINQAKKGI